MYRAAAGKTELQMDIASAYPAEAGIHTWIRTVSLEKKKNRLTLIDHYTAGKPLEQLTQTFMTVCPADIQLPGKIIFDVAGRKLVMQYDPGMGTFKK
jgi:hypothetical protein